MRAIAARVRWRQPRDVLEKLISQRRLHPSRTASLCKYTSNFVGTSPAFLVKIARVTGGALGRPIIPCPSRQPVPSVESSYLARLSRRPERASLPPSPRCPPDLLYPC